MAELIKQRYQLLDKLGQGGFGAVYKAFDEILSREVAIKLLNIANENQEEMVQRFQVESRVASRLEHQNILRVYDFGRDDNGRCFLVSELLKGDSLHAMMKGKRALQLSMALDILYQVGSALEAAHEQNTVHRDIKPPNIFLNQPMRGASFVKLLDFGIAKVIGGDESLTVTGQIMGTPHYMSPEQIVNIKLVDHRSDIYSLGIVFYQMLTGVVPFDDESYFTIMKRQMQSPMPALDLPQYPEDLTKKLNKIIKLMTRKDVRKRVSHISEILYKVQQVWAMFPELIQPRTTGVFQSVTSEIPRVLADEQNESRPEIDDMLESFEGADELVDQLFAPEDMDSDKSDPARQRKRVSSKDSLLDALAAPTQHSGEGDLSLVHRRTRAAADQSIDQDAKVRVHLLPNIEADLDEQLQRDREQIRRDQVEKLNTIDPPISDEFEIVMTPTQPEIEPEGSPSHQPVLASESVEESAQRQSNSQGQISAYETPMEPTVSASLIDQAPIVELSAINSHEMDTIIERPSIAYASPRPIFLDRLILLTLLLVAVILWRAVDSRESENSNNMRGLTMSTVRSTAPRVKQPNTSLRAKTVTGGRLTDSPSSHPNMKKGVKTSRSASLQQTTADTPVRAMPDQGLSDVGRAKEAQEQAPRVLDAQVSVDPTAPDQGMPSPSLQRDVSRVEVGAKDRAKSKPEPQAAPSISRSSKRARMRRKRRTKKRRSAKKTPSKLMGKIRLAPDHLTYEVGQRVTLKFSKSAPKTRAKITLGGCARWVHRSKRVVVFNKESTQCVLKACYHKPKGCISSRPIEVTGKLF